MKKRYFIFLEIVMPLIFFLSWLLWNLLIKKYMFQEAFVISTGITFVVFLLVNLMIALNYQKIINMLEWFKLKSLTDEKDNKN